MERVAQVFASRHEPLLGTRVDLRVRAVDAAAADLCGEAIVAEIGRLTSILSAHDQTSELCRWRRGEAAPGPDLTAVLQSSLDWQQRSEGTYNPAVGVLTERWRTAAVEGIEPSPLELDSIVAAVADPPYELVDGVVRIVGDIARLSFDAFAKGWIVDRALAVGMGVDGVEGLTVNAGGDLAHVGPSPVAVGIEDPARPYDNVAPLAVVDLAGGGLATSGSARRGFRVDGRWFGHVIDPRSGRPVDDVTSVSVIAHDAATADVVATIVGVSGPEEGLRFVSTLGGVGCLVITGDGECVADEDWLSRQRPNSRVRPW